MNYVLYPACVLIAFLALLLRLPALIRKPEPGLVALCLYFVSLMFTFGLSIPPVFVAVSKGLGVPNLAGMLTQCCALAAGVVQQLVVLAWSSPWEEAKRRIRRRLAFSALVIVAMSVLFALSVPQMTTRPHTFAVDSAQIPTYQAYLVLYLSCYALTLVETGRLCWRYSGEVEPGSLRRGLRVAAIGSAFGLMYVGARAADIIAPHLGGTGHPWEPLARIGAAGAAILMMLGWSLPTWAPPLSGAWAQVGRYRSYLRLGPLWRAVVDVLPGIALASPDSSGPARWSPRQLDFRLYRRMVEIRDARIQLQRFYSPTVATAARTHAHSEGLSLLEVEAVVEAANLAAAIEKKRADEAPLPVVDSEFDQPEQTGESLHEEQQWLLLVADAFARSPVVADVLASLRRAPSSSEVAL
ncbi:MAB_1171c family putative transporter [Nocardia sp. XZ_19_385]|uniref:MAB_1171c family putative transporter n=1 Tax=Nocardia sp. XZ_19_385 TaxID=2769488 RepID=UPI00188EB77F|nr:MAB_1171c family putative transporter [Nocardia sp. XZ_19_385]